MALTSAVLNHAALGAFPGGSTYTVKLFHNTTERTQFGTINASVAVANGVVTVTVPSVAPSSGTVADVNAVMLYQDGTAVFTAAVPLKNSVTNENMTVPLGPGVQLNITSMTVTFANP